MHDLLSGQAFDPSQLAGIIAATFAAGFIRGFGGFGFALAAVPLLSMILPPASAIPMVLILEIVLTALFLPSLWRLIDWRSVGWLAVGALIATPFGVWMLAALAPGTLRLLLGGILLASVWLLWRAAPRRLPRTPRLALAAGAASGLLSGGTAMSGPPIILFYMLEPLDVTLARASMMAFFLCSAGIALVYGSAAGVYAPRALAAGLLLTPIAGVGARLGSYCFGQASSEGYRRAVLGMLALIGSYAVASELWRLWPAP